MEYDLFRDVLVNNMFLYLDEKSLLSISVVNKQFRDFVHTYLTSRLFEYQCRLEYDNKSFVSCFKTLSKYFRRLEKQRMWFNSCDIYLDTNNMTTSRLIELNKIIPYYTFNKNYVSVFSHLIEFSIYWSTMYVHDKVIKKFSHETPSLEELLKSPFALLYKVERRLLEIFLQDHTNIEEIRSELKSNRIWNVEEKIRWLSMLENLDLQPKENLLFLIFSSSFVRHKDAMEFVYYVSNKQH